MHKIRRYPPHPRDRESARLHHVFARHEIRYVQETIGNEGAGLDPIIFDLWDRECPCPSDEHSSLDRRLHKRIQTTEITGKRSRGADNADMIKYNGNLFMINNIICIIVNR